jgi:hypothetical protein
MDNHTKKVTVKDSMALSPLERVIMLLLCILMGRVSLFVQGMQEVSMASTRPDYSACS